MSARGPLQGLSSETIIVRESDVSLQRGKPDKDIKLTRTSVQTRGTSPTKQTLRAPTGFLVIITFASGPESSGCSQTSPCSTCDPPLVSDTAMISTGDVLSGSSPHLSLRASAIAKLGSSLVTPQGLDL